MLKKIFNSSLVGLGFILSPLSWWNDLIVNIPISYAFSYPFTLISKKLFLPSFVTGYLLTNILGFVLIHKGIRGLRNRDKNLRGVLKKDLLVSVIYTILIVLLVVFGIIKTPTEYLKLID